MAGSSDAEIANRALDILGAGPPITSLDDDDENAYLLKRNYEAAVKATQARGLFWWTITRAKINQLSATPVHTYGIAWALPSDFLKLLDVAGTPADEANYRLEVVKDAASQDKLCIIGNQTSGAASTLSITYVKYVSVSGFFDPLYEEALATMLAYRCARRILSSDAARNALLAEFEEMMDAAEWANGQQIESAGRAESPWVEASGYA